MPGREVFIRLLSIADAERCVEIIRRSFATVAEEFGFTKENAPTHTSFITAKRWQREIRMGRIPYGLFLEEDMIGYVSLAALEEGWYEVNHLAVLPEYRGHGYGAALLSHCMEQVREKSGKGIRLSIVQEHTRLMNWYLKNGFSTIGTREIASLPFTIGDMQWRVNPPSGEEKSQ